MATFWHTFQDDGTVKSSQPGESGGCTPYRSIPCHEQSCGVCFSWGGRYQGVIKRCRLSWLTNSALVDESKCGGVGGGGLRCLSQWVQLRTWSSNKLWTLTLYLTYDRDTLYISPNTDSWKVHWKCSKCLKNSLLWYLIQIFLLVSVYLFQFVNSSSVTYKKRDQLIIKFFSKLARRNMVKWEQCLQYSKM